MNQKTKKEKALTVKNREGRNVEELYFARGKLKILDELFDELSDKQKEYSIITAPGSRYSFDEYWNGMTMTEKKKSLVELLNLG